MSPNVALLDTNILVYAVFPATPNHGASRALVDGAKHAGADLCIAPQNLVEFFAVVTDPRRVTQPKAADQALRAVEEILALPGLTLLPVPVDLIARWIQLLHRASVRKKRAFDAQLVATMQGNGVATIYTYNTADFASYPGVIVLEPPLLAAPPSS
jgi:toxin-antitoxin system PIN domain toxin